VALGSAEGFLFAFSEATQQLGYRTEETDGGSQLKQVTNGIPRAAQQR
jgi:hypothetical protein